MMKNIQKYINSGYKAIDGWYSKLALELIVEINRIQISENIKGSLCEVGVHHGRCFVLLSLISNNYEKSVAIDLFDNQLENIDQSGSGDKEILLTNLRKFNCDLTNVKVLTKNSLNLTPDELLKLSGSNYRFISLDGGHTVEIVQNDLALAESVLTDGGVILLDDYFDEKWPGVSEGALKYLLNQNSKLIPVAIFDDKILLTNNPAIGLKYKNEIKKLVPKFLFKETEFLGESCLVIYLSNSSLKNYLRKTAVWQTIKNGGIGNRIRTILK